MKFTLHRKPKLQNLEDKSIIISCRECGTRLYDFTLKDYKGRTFQLFECPECRERELPFSTWIPAETSKPKKKKKELIAEVEDIFGNPFEDIFDDSGEIVPFQ